MTLVNSYESMIQNHLVFSFAIDILLLWGKEDVWNGSSVWIEHPQW